MKKWIRVLRSSLLFVSLLLFATMLLASIPHKNAINKHNPNSILEYINRYRTEHGLCPLKLGKYLSEVASLHSRDMAERKIPFGHNHVNQRMQEIFEQYRYQHPQAFAENVAFNYQNNESEIVNQWLASPGHRKNIEGDYNWTGVGSAVDHKGRLYVTQIFLKINSI